ncbi:MAG TPA: ABC transporter substrate-binding protein [Ruminococcaceae bacterium]|nr:ABC transporter substrate-binding protein [Oscillospiraceae bacterium]
MSSVCRFHTSMMKFKGYGNCMLKKNLFSKGMALLLVGTLLFALFGCGATEKAKETDESKKLVNVVCTLFPQYDFVKQIAGDKVEITLLLTPGTDSHTYDPSPTDMVKINNCDLFLYTGDLMEAWAADVLKSVDTEKVTVVDLSKGVALSPVEHQHHEDKSSEGEADGHDHSVDPHIWTSPKNAKIMVQSIADALSRVDPENADFYDIDAKSYCDKLDRLDAKIRTVVNEAPLKEIVVCDRFAMHYFCKEYGLAYIAAFDSCTSETEPSPAVLAEITQFVKDNNIPLVFYAELSNKNLAEKVASLTGVSIAELHSAHNVSADDFADGVTYLDIMEQNLMSLKLALGVVS